MRVILRLFLILIHLGFFLLGCSSSSLILPEKTLRLSLEASPKSLDPANSTDTYSGIILGLVYSNLLRFNDSGELILDAAKFYSVAPGGRVYTFLLRQDARFSNGKPLTARDVVFSFERLASKKLKSPRAWLLNEVVGFEDFHAGKTKSIAGLRIDGDFKLRIELKRPFAPFLSMLAMPQLAIISEEFVRGGTSLNEAVMGSGPYKLTRWSREQDILLEGNPYYRKDGNLQAIYFKVIKEPLTMMTEFRSKNLHIIEVPPHELGIVKKTRARLHGVNQYNLYFLGLNMESGVFASKELRHALNYAIDRKKILDTVLRSQGSIATGPVPKGLSGYLSETRFPYDLDRAKALVKKSGYDGRELRLLVRNEPRNLSICEAMKQYLEAAGVKVKLVARDWNSFASALVGMEYDIFYRNWIADFPDGDNFLYPLFHSASTGLKGNYPRYSNSAFDALIENSRKEVVHKKRVVLLKKAAFLAREDASRVLLWYKKKNFAVYPGVQNFYAYPMYNSNKYLEVNLLTE
jgi:ABC-type transport system substrate-binding protein